MEPDERNLHAAFRALAEAEKAHEAPPRVEAEVMRRWDSVHEGESSDVRSGGRRHLWQAVAASLLLAVSLGGWWMTRQSEHRRAAETSIATPSTWQSYDTIAWLEPDAGSLQIVRLRVASATLKAQGYPITDPGGDGSVEIEMIVGLDGMARSVRVKSAAVPTY